MRRCCKTCRVKRLIQNFHKDKRFWDGISHECEKCYKNRLKNRKNPNRNKDKSNAYNRQYRKIKRAECNKYNKNWRKSEAGVQALKGRHRKEVENLTNDYILNTLKQSTGLSRQVLKQYPELIDSYKLQIKVKRLIKNRKNESIKTC
jgi:hypothetical protein